MTRENQLDKLDAESPAEDSGPISREALYELVWSEPMLRVATRFGVSSSYMARVCTLLHVPRPERGYWAKLAVGKAPDRPALPEPRPGDLLEWERGIALPKRAPVKPTPLDHKTRRRRIPRSQLPEQHPLLVGAKAHFEAGRESYDCGYLKPSKRLLVDVAVTKSALDKALSLANQLFLALEANGHRVVIASNAQPFHRAEVDEREDPTKEYHYNNLWAPMRCTVVYVGTVAIGLTLIEMSEEVEAQYIDGEYVRLGELARRPARRYRSTWTTRKNFATGRLCLQAYSPYSRTKWVKQWRETGSRDLSRRVTTIVRELEEATDVIVPLIEEAAREAEIARKRHQEWREQWEREQEEKRIAKALQDSKTELQTIIDSWAAAKSLDAFFADADSRIRTLPEQEREPLTARLERARDLVGNTDALARLASWRTPEER